MSFIVIIPARFFSTRFPGKLLADIHGKSMIVRVMEKALMSNAEKVIIATDHIDIKKIINRERTAAEVFLTSLNHNSGTERLAEVINSYGFSDNQIIVNLQGDEPLVSKDMINLVADDLISFDDISMSTLAVPIISINEIYSDNVVKVVVDINNYALYFSRSMIPWCRRNLLKSQQKNLSNIFLRHIGLYSYHVNFIRRYVNWKSSLLEKIESLEQLRILWYGKKIHVVRINSDICHVSVDTPEELDAVNSLLVE